MKKIFIAALFLLMLCFGTGNKELPSSQTEQTSKCGLYQGIPFGQKFCQDANLLPLVLKTLEVKAGDSVGK
jgi:hypothetical protein